MLHPPGQSAPLGAVAVRGHKVHSDFLPLKRPSSWGRAEIESSCLLLAPGRKYMSVLLRRELWRSSCNQHLYGSSFEHQVWFLPEPTPTLPTDHTGSLIAKCSYRY